ncbi:MAG: biotin/lipoyl-binding protein [Oscillospiraceae bacterium]|jgi:biotin carboxyl carrier protein|nr:biotin/lipoyl-binding protein [Oscillospiraceae bacterium]
MKRYNITVNGNTYDVVVEESGDEGGVPAAPPKSGTVSAPIVKSAQGAVKISSPMPGNIIAVKAKAGDAVKSGTVIAVLEAMKMENDIVAPQDGVIVSFNVAKGEQVNTGTVIATMN